MTFSVDPSSGPGVCSVSGPLGATVTYTGVGTCVIDANQAAGPGYSAAPQIQQSITVQNCAAPAIVSPDSANAVAGAPFSFIVTTCSEAVPELWAAGLPMGVHLVDNNNGTATISGTPGPRDTGRYAGTLTARQAPIGGHPVLHCHGGELGALHLQGPLHGHD